MWKIETKKIIGDAKNLTIEILTQSETGWLRIRIKPKESKLVNWQLTFVKQKNEQTFEEMKIHPNKET